MIMSPWAALIWYFDQAFKEEATKNEF